MKKYLIKRFLVFTLFLLLVQLLTLNFYISFLGFNIYSTEKIFTNGKRNITLLGMSHIGNQSYFEKIEKRYLNKDLIVLREGVTDNNSKEKNKSDEISHFYSSLIFGLSEQNESFLKSYKNINSDMDISNINLHTLDSLFYVFEIWKYLAFLKFDYVKLSYEELNKSIKKSDADEMYNEIILKRNNIIKKNIEKYDKDNLLIPWGAFHHNDLEDYLITNGYKEVETNYIKVFNLIDSLIHAIFYLTKGN